MEQISYNIIKNLQRKNNHIRSIAKDLKINHMTISRDIKKLYEKNIVDYRKEGKNNVFFLKETIESDQYIKIVEANKLINLIKEYPTLRRIISEIKKNKKIRLAILFGSYAKGIANKDSDIDIYVETTNKKLKEQLENIDSRLNIKIGKYDKNSLLIKEIEKNHVIIKGIEEYYEKE